MAPSNVPTMRRRRLGGTLRRLRDNRGLTQADAAAQVGLSNLDISRAETGRGKITIPLLRALFDIYDVTDPELRTTLEDMAVNISQRGWWHSYNGALHAAYEDFLGLEHDASSVRTWQTLLVPGLLQTEDYARALLRAGQGIVHTSPERITQLMKVRMERKQRLVGDSPLRLSAVVSEAALRVGVGGPLVMREQLRHLIQVAQMPGVSLRVLPLESGPHVGLDGPFALFSFPEGEELVFLEAVANSVYLEDPESASLYARVFDQIGELALDHDATRTSLEEMAARA